MIKKTFKISKLTVKYDLCDGTDGAIGDFMGVLKDYCKTSSNESIIKLIKTEKSVGASKIFNLVDNHSDSIWYYSTDSDIWYFNEIVTKTMIDYGYFSDYMEMVFSLDTIPNLRSEIVKYILSNWEWISAIYSPDLLDHVAKIYSELSLKNSRIEEKALRNALIKKVRNSSFNEQTENTYRKYDEFDPSVRKAVEFCIQKKKFSTSMLQAYLEKGHGFVSGLGLWLEDLGVIGPVNGNKPREVLISSMDEFDNMVEMYMSNNEEMDSKTKEYKKIDWSKETDKTFRKIGNGDVVMHGQYMYSYDDDCWRYAIGIYFDFVIARPMSEAIDEKEAEAIVIKNGGTNFSKMGEALFVTDKDGKYVSL